MAERPERMLRDASALTRWVRWGLYAQAMISVIALASGALELQFLANVKAGVYASQEQFDAIAIANDQRQGLVALVQFSVFVAVGILILVWIRRANHNARALGAHGMQFTPGWAIGWYFIPIANLWKPYQAMKEIWKASSYPDEWATHSVSNIVRWWWALWIIGGVTANIGGRLGWTADNVQDFINSTAVLMVSDTVWVAVCLVFLVMVNRIQTMQASHHPREAGHS